MTDELKQLQKQEALKRLKILQSKYGLPEYVVREFLENGTQYYSEHTWNTENWNIHKLSRDNFFETAVKGYEINNDAIIYYSIYRPSTNRGIELSMLYVSKDKCNWEDETKELLEGCPPTYCKNFDYDNESMYFYETMEDISFK